MLNLLEICTSNSTGGLEIYFTNFANFSTGQFSTSVLIKSNNNLINRLDTNMTKILFNGKISRIFPIKASLKLAKIIDDNDIDILHIHHGMDLQLSVLSKILSKKKPKLAYSRHMIITSSKKDIYHKFFYNRIDVFLPVANFVGKQIEKFISVPKKNIKVIYPGSIEIKCSKTDIDEAKKKFNIDRFSLILVGRILEKKGQHLAVEAIKILKDKGYKIKLYIIGGANDIDYKKKIQEFVINNNLQQDIIFIEFVVNIQKYVHAFDAALLTTYEETFGMVLPEAMLAHVPVIASNAGGPLEIIVDGESGLLFKTKDSNDLANKIELLYNDEALRERLIGNGYNEARTKFEYNNQFRKVADELKKLVTIAE